MSELLLCNGLCLIRDLCAFLVALAQVKWQDISLLRVNSTAALKEAPFVSNFLWHFWNFSASKISVVRKKCLIEFSKLYTKLQVSRLSFNIWVNSIYWGGSCDKLKAEKRVCQLQSFGLWIKYQQLISKNNM